MKNSGIPQNQWWDSTQVGGVELDWTLGAVLDGGAAAPRRRARDEEGATGHSAGWSLFVAAPVLLLLAAVLCASRPGRPRPRPYSPAPCRRPSRDRLYAFVGGEKCEP